VLIVTFDSKNNGAFTGL